MRSWTDSARAWSIFGLLVIGLVGCAPVGLDEPAALEEPSAPKLGVLPASVAEKGSLQVRLEAAIESVRQRQVRVDNGFWTIFHAILGLGPDLELVSVDGQTKVNALDYMFSGDFHLGPIRGMVFIPTPDGLDVQTGPVYVGQGHQDQFVAEMGQWGVPGDKPVHVAGREFTMMDFVRESQARARVGQGQELSWAIVVVAQYLGTDARWTNRFGEALTLEDLIADEVAASINQAACGGTHRLFGLTWCYYRHLASGGEETELWKRVAERLAEHRDLAREYQNPDGSFSTNYFRGTGAAPDLHARLASSGHILEWLVTYLPDNELREPWVERAVDAVSLMVLEAQSMGMESGALYHATHGLITYHHRVYERAMDAEPPTSPLAQQSPAPSEG